MRRFFAFSFLLFLLLLSPAAYSATPPAVPSLSWGYSLNVVLMLLVVLAAVVGMAWLLRRFTSGHNSTEGALKVLGGVAVGPKERVVLIEFRDTWLVIGVAPGRVNMLHSLSKPEGDSGESIPTEGRVRPPHFATWLNRAMKGRPRGK